MIGSTPGLRSRAATPLGRRAWLVLTRATSSLGNCTWLLLPPLVLPALWPLWVHGLTWSDDGPLHLPRLALFDDYLRQGILYPRWLPDLAGGLGSPVPNFYGMAVHYLAEIWRLAGAGYATSMVIALSIILLATGFGMYLLARCVLRSGWPALLAAVAYVYAPYLLINVYVRGSFSEALGQALLPWILWATWQLLNAPRPARYMLPLALSFGGLAFAHSVTLVLLIVPWIGVAVLAWRSGGASPARLGWLGAALVAALGISAFFWVPLLVERAYLGQAAFDVARRLLAANAWTPQTFLDSSLAFSYSSPAPFRLGLIQLALGLAGFALARRRDPLWLFLLVVSAAAVALAARPALPLWLSVDLLTMAQFPWRLLGLLSLTLALLTGGLLQRSRPEWQPVLVLPLVAIVILANRPQVGWMAPMPALAPGQGPVGVASFETETGAIGTTLLGEYTPRWATSTETMGDAALQPGGAEITALEASDFGLVAEVNSDGGPLRFTTFYFPGWQVALDGGAGLDTYPSTSRGLLTVDLPPGRHTMDVAWHGTSAQHAARLITLFTLACLALFYLMLTRERLLALVPAVLLIGGVLASISGPRPVTLHQPVQPAATAQVALLGYRFDQPPGSDRITLRPYWYVRETPPAGFRVHWQLLDSAGGVLSETESGPYFGTQGPGSWPPATVVDDAYVLPLPPGSAAGTYRLAVQFASDASSARGPQEEEPRVVGDIAVEQGAPPGEQPAHILAARFGADIQLAGYDIAAGDAAGQEPGTIPAGKTLEYTLYWQALGPLPVNYHAFVHLVDGEGRPVVQHDRLPGGFYNAPKLWDVHHLYADTYRLRIPDTTPSGLYWPLVGVYDFKTGERLPVADAASGVVSDHYRLPPVKVLGRQDRRPQHEVKARFEGLGELLGYDLAPPEEGVQSGSKLELTLYYRSSIPTVKDFTRFVHVYGEGAGMAGQSDGQPQGGGNPTSAWVPGEIIADRVELVIDPEAPPGSYHLGVGFYDAEHGGARLPALDAAGSALPDAVVDLTTVEIGQ